MDDLNTLLKTASNCLCDSYDMSMELAEAGELHEDAIAHLAKALQSLGRARVLVERD